MGISNRSKVNTEGVADLSPKIENGQHLFKFKEGIRVIENDYGRSLAIPVAIADEDDPNAGFALTLFYNIDGDDVRIKRSEGNLVDLLVVVGIDGEVDKTFNEPAFLFADDVLGKLVDFLAMRLPDRYIVIETRNTNNGKTLPAKLFPVKANKPAGQPAGFVQGGGFA